MRLMAGFLFACHGAQKLFGVLGRPPRCDTSPLMLAAGIIEFFGGLLIALGVFTVFAAFYRQRCEMATGYFPGPTRHMASGQSAITAKLAVLLCFVFSLHRFAGGDGTWSVRRFLKGQNASRESEAYPSEGQLLDPNAF